MISGIKLPSRPKMKGMTFEKIIGNLDLLKERPPEITFTSKTGTVIKRKEFWGDKYTTLLIEYSIPNDPSFKAVSGLFSLISTALPEFITTCGHQDRILFITYPKYDDWKSNESYRSFIDELQRLTLFLLSMYGPEGKDIICELLKKYVDLCVEFEND
jgi:hypothetical protein